METFSTRLRDLRQETGLSQRELAAKTGISPTSIRYWENGSRVPNLDAVITLAKFFAVTIDFLAGLEN